MSKKIKIAVSKLKHRKLIKPLNEATIIQIMDGIKKVTPEIFFDKFPPVIKNDKVLVDGEHRVEAAKRLGITEITVMDIDL